MEALDPKFALISVYDKSQLVSFARDLLGLNYKLLATGGSARKLQAEGLEVTEVSDFTKEPELFEGRLKTLSPKVFGGILFNREKEQDCFQSKEHKMPPIDLVVVNFYPFKEQAQDKGLELEEAIEFVDIGGPSLLRASAKNWKHTVPVSSPSDYSLLVDALRSQDLTDHMRQRFAAKAFKTVLEYDQMISSYFEQKTSCEPVTEGNSTRLSLRYGENPGQNAYLEPFDGEQGKNFNHLHGKELSYNNILDVDSGVLLVKDFSDTPVCAILKHTNPCGLAWGERSLKDLFKEALSSDPVSAFGGIIVTNQEVDLETAHLMNESFFECVVAPGFSSEALKLLKTKKNRRLVTLDSHQLDLKDQVKSTVLGTLCQSPYPQLKDKTLWEHKAGPVLGEADLSQLSKALCAVKHLKSNAIAFVKDQKAIGLASGHVSRVDACSHAISKAKGFKHDLTGSFMASDAFFPFKDCVDLGASEGVKAIIQPGGSVRDEESIEACSKHGISLYFCQQRYFKH